jgi:hypothetical protein
VTVGSSSRGGAKVRLLALHTTEGSRTCPSLLAFFSRSDAQGSSHAGVCDKCLTEFLPYDRASWTLRSGNAISDNLEMCGFARWTRAEWLQHMTLLDLTAQWLAARSKARGIPLVKLTPAEVKAGRSGVIGHVDWTVGMSDGTHTDPGTSFPWDLVLTLAVRYRDGSTTPEVDLPITPQEIAAISDAVANRGLGVYGALWQTLNAAAAHADAANKAVAALALKVDKIATGGATIDYAALAKAVNDDAAARLKA